METLILLTDIIEKAILVILLGLSVWSVSIIIDRRRYFKKYFVDADYAEIKSSVADGAAGALNKVGSAGFYAEAVSAYSNAHGVRTALHVDRAYSSFVKERRAQLEKGLGVLATLGANAPFIGLFGTVLGIIRALAYLGNQSGSASVMSGVSQALYATAVGLFVAIPAVIAYNYFSGQIKMALQRAESMKDLYVVRFDLK